MRQFKVNDELVNKVKRLISNDDKDKLIMSLEELHYADLAEIFESLEINEVIFLVKIFDKEKIADALAEIDEDLREIILENLSEKEIAEKIEANIFTFADLINCEDGDISIIATDIKNIKSLAFATNKCDEKLKEKFLDIKLGKRLKLT